MEGILIRRFVWGHLFGKLGRGSLIFPGGYFKHTYGLEVGDNFSTNMGVLIDARGGVAIGNHVMIGSHAVITSSLHDFRQIAVPMAMLDNIFAPTSIGDDVWIGAHAVIRGGLAVGRGAVIGAGAIVTHDVAEYSIVVGVPAREIGTRSQRLSTPSLHSDEGGSLPQG